MNRIDPNGLDWEEMEEGVDLATDEAWRALLDTPVNKLENLYCEVVCHLVLEKGIGTVAHSIVGSIGHAGEAIEFVSSLLVCKKVCHKATECLQEKSDEIARERMLKEVEEVEGRPLLRNPLAAATFFVKVRRGINGHRE